MKAPILGLLAVAAALGIALTWAAAWFDLNVLSALPADLAHLRDYRPQSTCTIYNAKGTLVDGFHIERRRWIALDELPDLVLQAFIAAEDRRFYTHGGVDVLSILRAWIGNLQAGSVVQGGSTITQQLVKNLLVGSEQSYIRKMREAVLALRLERELSKNELLQLYLNYIYLGEGNYGVEAASLDYYGVSSRELNIGQAATLAGLVQAPSRYSPRTHPEEAEQRLRYVLSRMVEDGYISTAEAERYNKLPDVAGSHESIRGTVGVGYLTEVRREIRRLFGYTTPFYHGFHVYTALDPEVQERAESALRDALRKVDERQGLRAVRRHLEPAERAAFAPARERGLEAAAKGAGNAQADEGAAEQGGRAEGRDAGDGATGGGTAINQRRTESGDSGNEGGVALPPVGECFEAMVGAHGPGELYFLGLPLRLARDELSVAVRSSGTRPQPFSKVAREGDLVGVCRRGDEIFELDRRPASEGAAVVLENATGRVLALVGGYEDTLEGFVRATQARRQPGSSFKPYVYAAALSSGRNQIDRVYDGPIALPAGAGRVWEPGNFNNRFLGWVSLRTALLNSLNSAAVRVGRDTGMHRVVVTAKAMGVRAPLIENLTVTLGAAEVTPMDQALGYATIARMGVPTDPVFIDSIRDADGALLGNAGGDVVLGEESVVRLPGGRKPRALAPATAYELADMMREVVRRGTGRGAYAKGYDRAGKTGTTNDFVDAWFVGFTPRYTVAVWVGTDSHDSLGDKETGGRTALPAWLDIARSLPDESGERLPVPDSAVLIPVAGEWMGFVRGQVPAQALRRTAVSPAPLPSFPGA